MQANNPSLLSHLDESGQANMVDVSEKGLTLREATAVGFSNKNVCSDPKRLLHCICIVKRNEAPIWGIQSYSANSQ